MRLMQAQDKEAQEKARVGGCSEPITFRATADFEVNSILTELTKAFKAFADGIKGPFWAGSDLSQADLVVLPWALRSYILEKHRGFDRAALGPKYKGKPSL